MSLPMTAGALAGLADPLDVLRRIEAQAEADELAPRRDAPDRLRLSGEGWAVDLRVAPEGLSFRLDAGDAVVMRSLKEMAAYYLGHVSRESAEALRWSDGAAIGAPPADLRAWRYVRRERLLPGLDRLVFAVEDASRYAGRAMHVRLLAPPCDGRAAQWPALKANGGLAWPTGAQTLETRVYTVRRARPEVGEVDVDVADHGPDLLAGWAARAKPGWILGALGPSGAPPACDGPLLAGADLCAMPALARILAADPAREGVAVVAAPPEAAAYLSPPPGVALRLLPPETGAEALAEACIAAAEDLIPDRAAARWWFAAEAKGARRMRAWLDAAGAPRARRDCAAYWRA